MRVLFLTRLFYPHIGGVEKHVLEVAKVLIRKGYDVTIICERHDPSLPLKEILYGVTIIRIPVKNHKWDIWKWLVNNISLLIDSDIIHCHDVFYWYLPFRFLLPFKKVYITFHGYEGTYPIQKKAILIRQVSSFLSNGNVHVGKFIEKWYRTKSKYTTYGGVVLQKQKVKKNKGFTILFLGRLDDDTSYLAYESVVDRIVEKNKNIRFIICGDGKYKNKTKKNYLYKGFVRSPSIYINNADVVFASSYLSILEALAYGKHVFTLYDNPLKEDYLKMSPFKPYISLYSDQEKLLSELYEVLIGKKVYNRQKTQQIFSKFTWDKVANIYMKLWTGKKN